MEICNRINAVKFVSVVFFISACLSAPAGANYCHAATGIGNAFDSGPGTPLNAVAVNGAGFNTSANFQTIIGQVLVILLGLLGVVFLILAITSGFSWMTAGGNEDKVETAKKTLTNSIIGMVVILAAYAIVRFVVEVIGDKAFK